MFSAPSVATAEEVVLPSECDGPDGVLHEVVVNLDSSVLQIAHHVVPAVVGVGDGFSYQALAAVFHALGLHCR